LSVNDWSYLSRNSNAIEILEDNLDKINWYLLGTNRNSNINTLNLIKKNQNKIDWYDTYNYKNQNQYENNNYLSLSLSLNPSIFELDYEKMRLNNQEFYEELIKQVMKPSRIFKYMKEDYDYIEELFDY